MSDSTDQVESLLDKLISDNMLISVPVSGECVTRNGKCEVGHMTAEVSLDGNVKLGFVSSKLHRSLNAWAHLKESDVDNFCKAWQLMRGHSSSLSVEKSINLVGVENHLVKALIEYIEGRS
jgi:hypothetical protein